MSPNWMNKYNDYCDTCSSEFKRDLHLANNKIEYDE